MIESFKLKFGRTPDTPAETIETTPLTIFIGPNNSGKSRLLNEIWRRCSTGPQLHELLLDELSFNSLTEDDADDAIERITIPYAQGEATPAPNYIKVGDRGAMVQIDRQLLLSSVLAPNETHQIFSSNFMRFHSLMLDGSSRLRIINTQTGGDFLGKADNLLQALARDTEKRKEMRRISNGAFGSYFIIDITLSGQIRARLSESEPQNEGDELSVAPSALRFQAKALLAEDASDGVRAYLGILAETIAGHHKVLLIDEPEAFLHPGLATMLGQELAKAARSSGKKVFVSTHSAAFLMGCIQSGTPINIVRLTFQRGVATARLLPADELIEMMRNPLLRSSGVLSGLFYEAVAVGEADTDRAFYQEVNERLLAFKPEWGVQNCLFLNAQNKDTIRTILRPLRKLGIPAAGIVDIDFLKPESNWPETLDSASVSSARRRPMIVARDQILPPLTADGKDMKTQGGLNLLEKEDKDAAMSLLRDLAEFGLFVVPFGEVESWLKGLGVPTKKSQWLVKMFERLGEDPEDANYVKPGEDDVWAFVGQLKSWLANPNRKGIPD